MGFRKIIIGDIHGCILELQELILKLDLLPNDQLFFLGDLIDKGPDSLGVVQFIHELSKKQNVKLVLGNHEDKFLRYMHNRKFNKKALADMKVPADFEILGEHLTLQEIALLKQSYFNYFIKEDNLLLLHGGISGNCSLDFSINYQYSKHSTKEFKGLDLITRTRYIDANGIFVSIGMESDQINFWAEVYDGKFGKVIFGHNPFLNETPKLFNHAIGLDTGCVFGGWLSAVIITESNLDYLSVLAKNKYAKLK